MDIIQKHNAEIIKSLESIEEEYKKLTLNINPWAEITSDLLFSFCKKGKMVRGNLLLESIKILSEGKNVNAVPLAASIELIHSGLLIHDDIMDQDALRRGNPTIHKQLEKFAGNSKANAEALAICIGDISFFVALNAASKYDTKISQKLTSEITLVGLGQMQDIRLAGTITTQTILNTYIYKTGRYTFSLPFSLAGILTHSDEKEIQILEKIGELLGTLYQIHDDYLGLFGNSKVTGKEAISDIQKNKATLYKAFLVNSPDVKIKSKILPSFGKEILTNSDVLKIQQALTDSGITKKVEEIKNTLMIQAEAEIEKLKNKEMKKFLRSILGYVVTRNS